MTDASIPARLRNLLKQGWRDLLSVYYANTPTWRWLKSGALLFFGFFLWSGSSVTYSVTEWRALHYTMAYGFMLLFWGPFTHMFLVPLTIRLRRNAKRNITRTFARNSGKINLTVFFTLVILIATFAPGLILLDFSPSLSSDGGPDVSGDLVCESGERVVSCEIVDAGGFDHVVVTSGGNRIATVDEAPYTFEIEKSELAETRTGLRFEVSLRDEDGNTLQRFIEQVTE